MLRHSSVNMHKYLNEESHNWFSCLILLNPSNCHATISCYQTLASHKQSVRYLTISREKICNFFVLVPDVSSQEQDKPEKCSTLRVLQVSLLQHSLSWLCLVVFCNTTGVRVRYYCLCLSLHGSWIILCIQFAYKDLVLTSFRTSLLEKQENNIRGIFFHKEKNTTCVRKETVSPGSISMANEPSPK